jgi:hypothetical protein
MCRTLALCPVAGVGGLQACHSCPFSLFRVGFLVVLHPGKGESTSSEYSSGPIMGKRINGKRPTLSVSKNVQCDAISKQQFLSPDSCQLLYPSNSPSQKRILLNSRRHTFPPNQTLVLCKHHKFRDWNNTIVIPLSGKIPPPLRHP